MKTYKLVDVTPKAYKKEVLDKYLCDWCNQPIENPDDYYDYSFELFNLKECSQYGDYLLYEDESWFVELCPVCIEKLRLLLVENGIKIQSGKKDYGKLY